MDYNEMYKPFAGDCRPNSCTPCDCNPIKPIPPAPCDCNPIKPIPPAPPVCPVPLIPENMTLLEQIRVLRDRQNMCIQQWNEISKNCYAALNQIVEGARMNDVYYSDKEVKYEAGYSEDEGCEYALIRKKVVDHCNKPIRVRLVLAFDNTTNSGVKQSIFDVSFIKSANVIISAVPYNSNNWTGPAMQGGDPIAYTTNPDGWIYGFNRAGVLRVFKGDVSVDTLCQNGMVDVIGNCEVILLDSALTETAQGMTTKGSITAIGYNQGTGEVLFFGCSNQNQTGMTGASVAKLLQNMGCNTAVITSIETETGGNTAAGLMYMGQMTFAPTGNNVPQNQAYWVVSKCENFCNDFQKEVSDLVQRTGRNMWETYLLGEKVDEFDGRITDVENGLQQEIQDRIDGDNALGERIDQETAERKAADEALDQKIEAETERATAAEEALDQKITAETQRATAVENQLAADIAAEKNRAIQRENEIQNALDSEIRERIAADNDIINSIEQEILARRAADTELQTLIEQVNNQLGNRITNIQTQIDNITGGTTNLPYLKLTGGTLTGPVVISGADNTLTVGRGPTTDLEVATKKYVDDAVAGGTSPGGDVSREYVDEQIANVQGQVDGKVSKTGDTMTGELILAGNPTNENGAVPKSYVDTAVNEINDEIDNIGSGATPLPYVKKSGDTMTGDLVMGDGATIDFNGQGSIYDDGSATVVKSESNGVTLMGTGVKVQNEGGSAVKLTNIAPGSLAGDAVEYSQLEDTNNNVSSLGGRLTTAEGEIDDLQNTVSGITSGTTDLPYVKKSGDTMTGNLYVSDAHIAIVDSDSGNYGSIEANNFGVVLGGYDSEANRVAKIKAITRGISSGEANSLEVVAGTNDGITPGYVTVNGMKIKQVDEPVDAEDAVNKMYVDGLVNSGSLLSDKWVNIFEHSFTANGNHQYAAISLPLNNPFTEMMVIGRNNTYYGELQGYLSIVDSQSTSPESGTILISADNTRVISPSIIAARIPFVFDGGSWRMIGAGGGNSGDIIPYNQTGFEGFVACDFTSDVEIYVR